MEVEKKRTKGGFLSFFDWGGKSRKKLFPNNTSVEELDGIKKVNENVDESVSRFPLEENDENRGSMKVKGNGDFNCASSTSSDDGHRTGAPSVVARLMGLDTMPNVNVNEPCLTQNMDSHSLRNGCTPGSSLNSRFEGFYMKDPNFPYNQDGFSRVPVAMTPQKKPGRPIERFQSETSPPRSAKTIPITHRKLLSPIKSPGFIPAKNAAYIMEATSRMIDHSPRTAINGRMATHASSSVPLRIRDLRERMEASQKSLRLQKPKKNAIRSNDNRKEAKTLNGAVDASRMKAPLNLLSSSSESSRSRGKVGPHTEVVKSDIQGRDMKNSTSHRVVNEAASKQTVKRSQQVIQRTELPRTATVRTYSVLKQNNQKQNNTQSGNSSTSNSSVPNQLKKKFVPTNGSLRTNKTARKSSTDYTRSRKDVTNTDVGKQYPVSEGKKAREQKIKNVTSHSADLMSETVLVSKDGKFTQCYAVVDGGSSWASSNNKDGMDVISFTFSSPIKKHASNPEDNGRVMGSGQASGECSQNSHNSKMSPLSPQRFNGMGADALGILLEQKLKELTCRVDSSCGTFNESHETGFQDSLYSSNVAKTSSEEHNSTSQFCIVSEYSDSVTEQESNSYDLLLGANRRPQEIDDCYSVSKKNDSNKKLDAGLDSFSYAEDSSSNEGWCSSGENSCSVQEVTMCEVTNTLFVESYIQAELEVDSLEASSWKLAASCDGLLNYPSMAGWESRYLRDVISHAEPKVNHYMLGQVDNVINSDVFDQLENQPHLSDGNKFERRLLFDCISELTNHRYQLITSGCSRSWSSYQSESLFLELYREISSLRNMEELMVDEVVDKDMSSGKGRWVEFDVEASEECIEMDKLILSSLMDEVIADLC